MMKHSIKVAALALVAMFAFSTASDAQIIGVLNRAKSAIKESANSNSNSSQNNKKVKLAIPKTGSGDAITFTRKNMEGVATEVAKWNPASGEITVGSAVYKLDPNTGQVTDASGASKGSMSADGTVEAPNFGTIKLNQDGDAFFYVYRGDEKLGAVVASMGEIYYGDRRLGDNGFASDKSANPLLMAYIFYGLVYTQDDLDIKSGKKSRTYEVRNWKTGQMTAVTDKELGGFIQADGGNVLLKAEDMLITAKDLYNEEENWKDKAAKKSIIEQILSDDKFDNRKRDDDDIFKDRKIVAVLFRDRDWQEVYAEGEKTGHSVRVIIVSELANGLTRADWNQYKAAYKGFGEYSETINKWGATAKYLYVIDWKHQDDADPLADL
jgi:hypothetical protein